MSLQVLLETQEANKQAGGKLLGTIFGWDLNSDFRLNQQQFLTQGRRKGIPREFLPTAIEAKDAFRKATKATRPVAHKRGWQVDVIENKGEEYIIGLSSKCVDKEATVKVRSEYAGDIQLEDWHLHCNLPLDYLEFENAFKERFEFYQEYTSDSARELLCKFVQKYGTRLNKRGGSYFVPANARDLLERVAGFVEELGAAKGFERFELYGSAQNQQQVAQTLNQNFEVEIAQLLRETRDFIASAEPSRKTFDASLNRRREEVIAIQERLKLFEEILSFKAGELRDNLGQVSRMVLEAEVSQFSDLAVNAENIQSLESKYGEIAVKLEGYPDLKARLDESAPAFAGLGRMHPAATVVPIRQEVHPDILAVGF